MQRICGFCNNYLPDKVTKCPTCQKNVCFNCGNVLGIAVSQCPRCGQKTMQGALETLNEGIGSIGKIMMVVGLIIIVVLVAVLLL